MLRTKSFSTHTHNYAFIPKNEKEKKRKWWAQIKQPLSGKIFFFSGRSNMDATSSNIKQKVKWIHDNPSEYIERLNEHDKILTRCPPRSTDLSQWNQDTLLPAACALPAVSLNNLLDYTEAHCAIEWLSYSRCQQHIATTAFDVRGHGQHRTTNVYLRVVRKSTLSDGNVSCTEHRQPQSFHVHNRELDRTKKSFGLRCRTACHTQTVCIYA